MSGRGGGGGGEGEGKVVCATGASGYIASWLVKFLLDRGYTVKGTVRSLNGTYQRLFMISYLDEEILIIRDAAGIPEVLTRLEAPPSPMESIPEYDS